MKIRSGFVTNSSSSSFLAISITSKKLAEIVKKNEKLGDWTDSFRIDADGDQCVVDGETIGTISDIVPQELNNVMDSLIEVLHNENKMLRNMSHPLERIDDRKAKLDLEKYKKHIQGLDELLRELEEQKADLPASIEEVDWTGAWVVWGGDDISRLYPSSYSKETLQKIYAAIAMEKGCTVEDVTEDDFAEYTGDKCSVETDCFTYSKARGGKGEHTHFFDLKLDEE